MGTTTSVPGHQPGTTTAPHAGQQHAPNTSRYQSGGAPPPSSPRPPDGRARHSFTIARISGIPLQLHWSFFALLVLVAVAQWSGGASAIWAGLAWVGILFASVVVHELAHCVEARRRGSTVLSILLLPIGGMSRMASLPQDPGGEAAVAAAGPAISLLIGGALLTAGAVLGSSVWPPTLAAGSWWARIGWLNLFLGAFNLLPALPMDGGRILRAMLARKLPKLAATRIATTVARILAVGMVIVGFALPDLWLLVLAVFVYLGASAELAQVRLAEFRQSGGFNWQRWQGPPPGSWPPPPGSWPPPPGWMPPNGWTPPPGGAGAAPSGPPPWGYGPAAAPAQPGRWQPPPEWGPPTAPPYPANPTGSAIDVAVEAGGGEPAAGQALGQGVGQHH